MLGRPVPRLDQMLVKENNTYIPLHRWLEPFGENSDIILGQIITQVNEILRRPIFMQKLYHAWDQPHKKTIRDIIGITGDQQSYVMLLAYLAPQQIYPPCWLLGVIRINQLHRPIKWSCQYHFI